MEKFILFNRFVVWFAVCMFLEQTLLAQCGNRYSEEVFNNVVVTQDINYGASILLSGDVKTLKFDFYEPEGDTFAQRPLIVLAHGGGFIDGDENTADMQLLGEAYAKRGYVVASINYRLANIQDFLQFPSVADFMADELVKAVHDMKAAIRFFRQDADNADIYRIDPNQIFIGGTSAGALTAINLAYLDTDAGFDDYTAVNIYDIFDDNGGFEGNSGNPGYSTSVNGVIGFAGAVADTLFVQAGEEPFVGVHNTGDGVVPYSTGTIALAGLEIIEVDGSVELVKRLQNLGVNAELLTYESNEHVDFFSGAKLSEIIEFTGSFIADLTYCDATGVNIPTIADTNPLAEAVVSKISTGLLIDFKTPVSTPVNIEVFNLHGKQLYSLNGAAGSKQIAIPIAAQVPAGIYVLRMGKFGRLLQW